MGRADRDKRLGLGGGMPEGEMSGSEMNAATVALRPETVLAEMRKNRVTDVV
jgi:hypothetical protein